ncbi:glycosyltransferase family 4 protein [Pseudoalteromonas shioyasakiensis]|uniref:glycosyltransferase family 4 protein n=1 Tax=Pseudoalteromonas shioyasakiensis TaxID=1190813 RepID=UPI001EFC7FB0|nr:glycosyltransferase family 4 protein [Pseudoalteromonas shioyasakiensis]MCG9736454.1 glycosyltransferase family 4 protein [Pseudoalteromonas shioyasakiensis]
MKAKNCFIIGPFPPPVHGMSKNLLNFYKDVNENINVTKVDTSPASLNRGLKYHSKKFVKVINGGIKLFYSQMLRRYEFAYLPPDAGYGAYYSLLFVLVLKLFKVPVIFHHRSFNYVSKKTLGMTLITKLQPAGSKHIFLCEKMKREFLNIYQINCETIIISNAMHVSAQEKFKPTCKPTIKLGHLSNLGVEKGLIEIFKLCEQLDKHNFNYELLLAGPAENDEIASVIKSKLSDNSKISYLGYVDPKKKIEFFNSIDIFLFPTQYRNEAQPNVLFESFSFGVPALTLDIGCIFGDVDCKRGVVFKDVEDFRGNAAEVIIKLSQDNKLDLLKESTLISMKDSIEISKKNYSDFMATL